MSFVSISYRAAEISIAFRKNTVGVQPGPDREDVLQGGGGGPAAEHGLSARESLAAVDLSRSGLLCCSSLPSPVRLVTELSLYLGGSKHTIALLYC